MKKFLLEYTLFRLLNPILNGTMVYLLILLVNNNIEQLRVSFFGNELLICILLSYIIQEVLKLEIIFFNKYGYKKNELINIVLQTFTAVVICILVVSIFISVYYELIFGFLPSTYELLLFNSVFTLITLSYILLFITAKHLQDSNNIKLQTELVKSENIKANYLKFKQTVNPNLLISSLETLISLVRNDSEKSNDLINHLARLYKYPLVNKTRQLIPFKNELNTCFELLGLINLTPSKNVTIESKVSSTNFLVVPGSLLIIIQEIVNRTIHDEKSNLFIKLYDSDINIYFNYLTNDRLSKKLTISSLSQIQKVYSIYSSTKISVIDNRSNRCIEIPKLIVKS